MAPGSRIGRTPIGAGWHDRYVIEHRIVDHSHAADPVTLDRPLLATGEPNRHAPA
jgi:hypothetical protein